MVGNGLGNRRLRKDVAMEWLPLEFEGERCLKEALSDLNLIASAPPPYCDVHVDVYELALPERPRKIDWPYSVVGLTGPLAYDGLRLRSTADNQQAHHFTVGDVTRTSGGSFHIHEDRFRWAHLTTLDGADYYFLNLQLERVLLQVSDAYND
jgi:hypothetical protein